MLKIWQSSCKNMCTIIVTIYLLILCVTNCKLIQIVNDRAIDDNELKAKFSRLPKDVEASKDPVDWGWDLRPTRYANGNSDGNDGISIHQKTWILLHGVGGEAHHMIPFAEAIAEHIGNAQIITPQA